MDVLPKKAIINLKVAQHGGLDYALLRRKNIKADDILDFSTCLNPFGPSPQVYKALNGFIVNRYPDTMATVLREKLADLNGLEPEQVLVSNGASQAILLISVAYVNLKDTVLVQEPAYEGYRVAGELMGAKIVYMRSHEKNNFYPDINEINNWIIHNKPRVVWLCNPNNPTGIYLKESEVYVLLEACCKTGSLLVLDESYINFVPTAWSSANILKSGNIILLRSMTKDFALPGIRLGYVLASTGCIEALSKAQPPWSINIAAQEAGLAALESKDYYYETWEKLRNLTPALRSRLIDLGIAVLPSQTNFLLLRIEDSENLQDYLWNRGIIIRGCSSFGLQKFVRLGIRLEEENLRLLACIKNYLAGRS